MPFASNSLRNRAGFQYPYAKETEMTEERKAEKAIAKQTAVIAKV